MSKLVEHRLRNSPGAEARVYKFTDMSNQDLADVLVPDANYLDISWNVTKTFVVKGLKSQFRLHFVNSDAKVDRGGFQGDPLAAPFIDFAKAYIRYRHAAEPVSYSATNRRVFGLRCVEAAFRDLGRRPEIWRLDSAVLTRAVEIGTAGKATTTAYKIGLEIEGLYKFCIEMQFLASAFTWIHGISYPGKPSAKVTEEFKNCYAEKYLSFDTFVAPDATSHASNTWADQVYSCVAALLSALPIKPHELFQLRAAPEIELTGAGGDGEHKGTFGLQVWPGKGDPPQIKWVSDPEYATIAKRAVQTLRELLAPARDLARWYDRNPTRLYLSPHLEHLRKAEWLVVSEVQEILGFSRNAAHKWIGDNDIAKRVGERRVMKGRGHGRDLIEVRFGDVERAVLSLIPKDFPYVNGDRSGHRYSEALLVVHFNALHVSRSTWKCMFEAIGYEQFYAWLRCQFKNVPPPAEDTVTPPSDTAPPRT